LISIKSDRIAFPPIEAPTPHDSYRTRVRDEFPLKSHRDISRFWRESRHVDPIAAHRASTAPAEPSSPLRKKGRLLSQGSLGMVAGIG
jgi:hypothetical protein